jgi:hypothetical protein
LFRAGKHLLTGKLMLTVWCHDGIWLVTLLLVGGLYYVLYVILLANQKQMRTGTVVMVHIPLLTAAYPIKLSYYEGDPQLTFPSWKNCGLCLIIELSSPLFYIVFLFFMCLLVSLSFALFFLSVLIVASVELLWNLSFIWIHFFSSQSKSYR